MKKTLFLLGFYHQLRSHVTEATSILIKRRTYTVVQSHYSALVTSSVVTSSLLYVSSVLVNRHSAPIPQAANVCTPTQRRG